MPSAASDQGGSAAPNYWFGGAALATTDNGKQAMHPIGRDAPIPSSHRYTQPFVNYNPLLSGMDSLNLFPPLFASMQRTDNLNILPSLFSSIQRSAKCSNIFSSEEGFTEPHVAPVAFHKHGGNGGTSANGHKDKGPMTSTGLLSPSFQQLLQPPSMVPPLPLLPTGWSTGVGGYLEKTDSQNEKSGSEQPVNSEEISGPSSSLSLEKMHTSHFTSTSEIPSITTVVSNVSHNELTSRNCQAMLAISDPVLLKQATPTRSELRNTETPEGHVNQTNGLVHNTLRKTRSDMKVIHRYLIQVKHDSREIHLIPYYELDEYIQDFVLTAKKKDGHEYEPESLKAFVHSLERHLKQHGYPHSVLKGSGFAGTRTVLNQRLSELRALSRASGSTSSASLPLGGYYGDAGGNGPGGKRIDGQERGGLTKRFITAGDHTATNMAGATGTLVSRSFTPAALIENGLLGTENPQAIINSLWLINRTQFNIGGTQRHRNLVWGQFQIVTDELKNKVMEFKPLFESAEARYCRGYGGSLLSNSTKANDTAYRQSQPLSCIGSAKRQPLPFNCVELFQLYASLRPQEARGFSEPFYLAPDMNWEQTGNWFKTSAAGSQLLSRVPRLLGLKPSREPVQSQSMISERHEVDPMEALALKKNSSQKIAGFAKTLDRHGGHNILNQHQTEALNYKASADPNTQMPMTSNQTVNFPLSPPCQPLGPASLFNLFPFMCPPFCESVQNKHPFFPFGGLLNPAFSNPDYPLGLSCKSSAERGDKVISSSVTSSDHADVKSVQHMCHQQKFSGSSSTPSPDHTVLPSPPRVPQTHYSCNLSVSPMPSEGLALTENLQGSCSTIKMTACKNSPPQGASNTTVWSEMATDAQDCVTAKDGYTYPGQLLPRNARNLSPSSAYSPSTPPIGSAVVSEVRDNRKGNAPNGITSMNISSELKSENFRPIIVDHCTAYATQSSPLGDQDSVTVSHAYLDETDSKDASGIVRGERTSAWVDEAMNLTRCKQEESGLVV